MADLMSILASNYTTVGTTSYSKTAYVPVDKTLYEGNWSGKYASGKSFNIAISNVDGFRAKVRYQSGDTVKYSDVLIKDSAFKIGDSKFTLTATGKAQVKTVLTDAATGTTSLTTAYATKSS